MLVLNNIVKDYVSGDTVVRALNEVSVCFRKNEFVSILGHSGCGKTTMLNIIGGLDRYTSGVMSIKGVSTAEYKDADWDTYRNHSIGFVFQSYNLIPHQTVLSNVELALTLTGVSKSERRKRAEEVLKRVGLGDQLYKKPSQMSGGQMQRVAIARALINDPEILLADEPTGALDTDTSVQIMELLKEISGDKLIIMVTHNPELAEKYSDRIIKLKDGKIIDDNKPYSEEEEKKEISELIELEEKEVESGKKVISKSKKKKPSMSFFTALSLSFNNLLTKKGRTFLTSFAGSIGIIGIALILSLSSGINAYIQKVQKETLTSYPISIQKERVDMSSMIMSIMGSRSEAAEGFVREDDKVYVSTVTFELMQNMMNPDISTNNMKKFKDYIEKDGKLQEFASLIRYGYKVDINAFLMDKDSNYVKADIMALYQNMAQGMGMNSSSSSFNSSVQSSNYSIWEEMLPPDKGSSDLVHGMVKEQYDLVAGKWPEDKSEILLVISGNNNISDMSLYSLGLVSYDDMLETMIKAMRGEKTDTSKPIGYSYDELIGIKYKLIPTSDYYVQNDDGEWIDISKNNDYKNTFNGIVASGLDLEIVGIIRQNPDASSGSINGTLVYTSALTDYIIEETAKSEIVKAQIANENVDVLNGLPFKLNDEDKLTDENKPAAFKSYLETVSLAKKAEIYRTILSTPSKEYVDNTVKTYINFAQISEESTKEELVNFVMGQMGDSTDTALLEMYFDSFDAKQLYSYIVSMMEEMVKNSYAEEAQKKIIAIENTPTEVELDAYKALEVLNNIESNNWKTVLLSLVTDEEMKTQVQSMPAFQAKMMLIQLVNTYASSDNNMNLYNVFKAATSIDAQKKYLAKKYIDRTALSASVINDEIDRLVNEQLFDQTIEKEIESSAKDKYSVDAQTQNNLSKNKKVASAFDKALETAANDQIAKYFDEFVPVESTSTYKDNLKLLGVADKDDPNTISIYVNSFEDKDKVSDYIAEYNAMQQNKDDKIRYTDYIGLLLSAVTEIVNAISYVLIFFVSISLVVSSIMIGIITYISVLERTKEIGILRAMGASKKDVSRVFNAETLIVGLTSGLIGIVVTIILNIPISIIIKNLSDISGLASLPIVAAVILVFISMGLTLISGLIPSRVAAKKDPVEALRSE